VTATETATPGVLRGPFHKVRAEPKTRTVMRRDVTGAELGEVELEPLVFGIEPNPAVLHQVVTAQLAAARSGTQSTRTRAEVRGGGAKPYRQKGTGRARQGSTRSPQWVGGGVALGPKPRSYRQKTPKKMVRLALHSALSDRADGGRVALVDRWGWEAPRTKDAVAALDALGLDGDVLVVLGDDDVVVERSFANLPAVQVTLASELCAYDILCNDWVVFTDESLAHTAGIEIDETTIIVVDTETGDAVVEVVEDIIDHATGDRVEIVVAEEAPAETDDADDADDTDDTDDAADPEEDA
jgi:large subunit ribosomal protein L4